MLQQPLRLAARASTSLLRTTTLTTPHARRLADFRFLTTTRSPFRAPASSSSSSPARPWWYRPSWSSPARAAASSAASAATATTTMLLPSILFRVAGAAGGWVALDFAIQWIGFAVSYPLRTEKMYDMLGTSTFALVAVGSFLRSAFRPGAALLSSGPLYARQAVATGMVALWAARLGSFLVYRVHKTGGDSRFDEFKHRPLRFFVSWTLQAVWVAVVVSPVLLLNVSPVGTAAAAAATTAFSALRWTDVAGLTLWLTGMATEAVADQQKLVFKLDPANKGKFVDAGLWSLARHPNYGGEIAAWSGLGLFCAGSGLLKGWSLLACAASPAFVAAILLGLSGVPVQKKQAEARWGRNAAYKAYKARTNLLVPVPFALPGWLGGPEEPAGRKKRNQGGR